MSINDTRHDDVIAGLDKVLLVSDLLAKVLTGLDGIEDLDDLSCGLVDNDGSWGGRSGGRAQHPVGGNNESGGNGHVCI